MSAVLDHEHVHTPDDTDDEGLVHRVCCREDKGLCGTHIDDDEWLPEGSYPNDCIVCELMTFCPICGDSFE